MKSRRGASGLGGVLAIDKPGGMTSHDVVAVMRRATGERRIGHAGTLDPMATGLLLVLVGRAARLERYLSGHDKTYVARIVFGSATDTLDADGTVTEEVPVPPVVDSPSYAKEMLQSFCGQRMQTPPAYSAIKVAGTPAHRIARTGVVPELAAREITLWEAEFLGNDPVAHTWDVRFRVSKGTYIRSLADDIGRAVGTVAHLGTLRRTEIGTLGIRMATGLDEACEHGEHGSLCSLFLDPVELLKFPVVEVPETVARNGRPIYVNQALKVSVFLDQGCVVSVVSAGKFIGVYTHADGILRAETVFEPGLPL